MQFAEMLYGGVVRAAVPALQLVAPLSDRLRRGVRGRAAALASMQAWGETARDPARPLVWLHAPSVGEALMAQAVLEAVRSLRADVQSVFTHFSPSAERMAARVGADWAGYLPWDRPADVRVALDAVRPDCIAFVRSEIWPVLLQQARAGGATAVLVNAVLAARSSRTGFAARALLGHAYRSLDAIGAVSADDAARFRVLGVDTGRIAVTGDARFDQVMRRVATSGTQQPLATVIRALSGPWLVAGSTWPADEAVLIPAVSELRARGTPLRVLIAPHEPAAAHVSGLEARVTHARLTHARFPAAIDQPLPDVAVHIVDRVGLLADLYAAADVAYVGGGFGSAGLHSIIEPAALGVPVIYGPRHGSAREAARLEENGGGFVVHDGVSLASVLGELLRHDETRRRAARAARAFVESQLGGATANAALIGAHLRAG